MASLAKRFPIAYWTSYGVLGKALPSCLLDIVWRSWQSASLLPIGHRMAFLAKRFPLAYWTLYGVLGKALAYWTLYDVLGKALPTYLLDIVWRPW